MNRDPAEMTERLLSMRKRLRLIHSIVYKQIRRHSGEDLFTPEFGRLLLETMEEANAIEHDIDARREKTK